MPKKIWCHGVPRLLLKCWIHQTCHGHRGLPNHSKWYSRSATVVNMSLKISPEVLYTSRLIFFLSRNVHIRLPETIEVSSVIFYRGNLLLPYWGQISLYRWGGTLTEKTNLCAKFFWWEPLDSHLLICFIARHFRYLYVTHIKTLVVMGAIYGAVLTSPKQCPNWTKHTRWLGDIVRVSHCDVICIVGLRI
jgi:hypothetical protein